jgi:VWFA-related protein
MSRRAAPLVFSALLLLLGAAAAGGQEPEETFEDEITVALSTLVVRAVDTWGRPILDLGPEDFRVLAAGEEVPVLAVDWVTSSEAEEAPALAGRGEITGVAPRPADAAPPGKRVVFFVQADLEKSRISGHLRLRPHLKKLLGTLAPEDRVAVVSYDSHLKLRLDFTRDLDAVRAALDRSLLFGEEPEVAVSEPVSLARRFDAAAGRRAASPERALELTARAVKALPGEKTMIYVGWGLGRFGGGGVKMTPAFQPAIRALKAARVSVFVLDVTSADSHDLQAGLEMAAEATGGLYLSTFRLPTLATEILARTISGHYVLTLDRDRLPEGEGELRIELRDWRRGSVLARPAFLH